MREASVPLLMRMRTVLRRGSSALYAVPCLTEMGGEVRVLSLPVSV